MKNSAEVRGLGEVVSIRVNSAESQEVNDAPISARVEKEKLGFRGFFVATTSIFFIVICFMSGAFSGYKLLGSMAEGSVVAAISGAALSLMIDGSLINSYLRKMSFVISAGLHILSYLLVFFGIMSLFIGSQNLTDEYNKGIKIASVDLAEYKSKLSELDSAKSKADIAMTDLTIAKSKTYKGEKIWDITEQCTATGSPKVSHPRDCAAIRSASIIYSQALRNVPDYNKQDLEKDIASIMAKYPILKLDQATSTESSLDIKEKSAVEKIIDILHLDISINDCIFWVSILGALGMQLIMAGSVTPFVPSKKEENGDISGSAGNKSESKNRTNAKFNFFRVFSPLAEIKARFISEAAFHYAEKKASADNARVSKLETQASALLDMDAYLKTMSAKDVGSLLTALGGFEKIKPAMKVKLTNSFFWGRLSYASEGELNLRDFSAYIIEQGLEAASFANYGFVWRNLIPCLVRSGLVEKAGSGERSAYYWVSEERLREVIKGAQLIKI